MCFFHRLFVFYMGKVATKEKLLLRAPARSKEESSVFLVPAENIGEGPRRPSEVSVYRVRKGGVSILFLSIHLKFRLDTGSCIDCLITLTLAHL